ncbi:MAG TPA: M48 family metallopeptidase [Terriglobia bacterium]|jgi:predicted Zn-dependent protease|nr:M48 family metallopeptidase [Terriglobia bacterium]
MKMGVLVLSSLLCVSQITQSVLYADAKNSNVEDIGNRDINKGNWNFTSLEKEIALGRSLATEIEKQVKLVSDPEITEYVSRVGQNIVRNSDAKVPFTIKVIDSEEINAFALPGGFLYVNSGLITTADEESELAGVLAHEIAHVAARHGTEQQAKATIADFARIPLVIFSGGLAQLVYNVYGLVVPLQFLQFSRGAEAEADYLGVQYLYKTGYDPASFISYFEKVQAQEKKKPGRLSKIFSTHPPTADRIEKSQKNIATVLPDRDEYVLSTSEFDKIKAKLIALDNARKPAPGEDSKRPTLKRRTPTDDGSDEPQPSDDDRPTLKRRTPQAIS